MITKLLKLLAEQKEPFLVLGLGAFGGLLAWIWSQTIGVPLNGGWWACPFSMLLGAGSSFVGVFLIANTDTRALNRCLAFAMLCGFCWKPVWEASGVYIQHSVETKKQEAAARALTLAVEQGATSLTTSNAGPGIAESTAAKSIALLSQVWGIRNRQIKDASSSAVDRFLSSVAASPSTDLRAKIAAFQQVGSNAAKMDNTSIAERSLNLLNSLATPTNSPESKLKAQAIEGLKFTLDYKPGSLIIVRRPDQGA